MKKSLAIFFERMLELWRKSEGGYPKVPWDPDVEPFIWKGDPDEHEWVQWSPVEKNKFNDVNKAPSQHYNMHPSIQEYFNSWWFCSLEFQTGNYILTLEPVLPGIELDNFFETCVNYELAHGSLNLTPIGFESNGLLVVINNKTGVVYLEDFEEGGLEYLASSLSYLIDSAKI